jgi:hypothetical protein
MTIRADQQPPIVRFANALRVLSVAYPRWYSGLQDADLRMLAALLDGIDPDELEGAAIEFARTSKFPPTPAELREIANRATAVKRRKALERGQELARAVQCRDQLALYEQSGDLGKVDPRRISDLRKWAAFAPTGVPVDVYRTPQGVDVLAKELAERILHPKPAALPAPSPIGALGCTTAKLAGGAAVIAIGFFLGKSLVSLEPVRAARGRAFEVARSAASRVDDAVPYVAALAPLRPIRISKDVQ